MLLSCTLLGTFASNLGQARAAPTKRALVIGIDTYIQTHPSFQSSAASDRGWEDLDGAVNDALAIATLLQDKLGYEAGEIKLLRNGQATRGAILAHLAALLNGARAGDERFFFFSGHGSQIPNSASTEHDKLDETLVPADAYSGAADIRDKELRVRFASAAQAGVRLTVVLDSCHSGSAMRGLLRPTKGRSIHPAQGDVADPVTPPDPVATGALVLAAAQDNQRANETRDEFGQAHGAFTAALVSALRSSDAAAPVALIFSRTQAIMQRDAPGQQPRLAANEQRLHLSLMGRPASGSSARTRVAVSHYPANHVATLQGGLADGLAVGAELQRVSPANLPPLRVRVTQVDGLSRATAQVVDGPADGLRVGDVFELTKWVAADHPLLTVGFMAPTTTVALAAANAMFVQLKARVDARWVDDVGEQRPTHILRSDGRTFWLEHAGASINLGARIDSARLRRLLNEHARQLSGPVSVGLVLPPTHALVSALAIGPESENPAIAVDTKRERAQYELVLRPRGAQFEAAWVLLGNAADDALPRSSAWVPVGAEAPGKLTDMAIRLARARGWLFLKPPDAPATHVPYRLVLRRLGHASSTDSPCTTMTRAARHAAPALQLQDTVEGGEWLEAWLDATEPLDGKPTKYVYVFSIDPAASGVLVFPRGGQDNHFPVEKQSTNIPLECFKIGEPFGRESYYLLATTEPIPQPEQVLNWEGARGGPSAAATPLVRMLQTAGSPARAPTDLASLGVKLDWHLSVVQFWSRSSQK